MTIFFLASFIGGLLLAVRIMIVGVERSRDESPSGERSFRLSPPVLSSMAVVFGITGYVLARLQLGTVATQASVALILAALTGFVAARLVRDWWKITPEFETEDERYVLQGHVGRVTRAITPDVEGEVAYELGQERHVLPARGVDDSPLTAGSEVVIERIEDGIAYVESWAEVEKRL